VALPERQLASFVAKFTPQVARLIRATRRKMRALLPHAVELVYDNYNFFVIAYGPTERPSQAIFSLAAQAKGVRLYFAQGIGLPDPKGLLRGEGRAVRSIDLESAAVLERAEVGALADAALKRAKVAMFSIGARRVVIKSVPAKQRPRRPVGSSAKKLTAEGVSRRKARHSVAD
jgi:hypothetical protein